MTKQSLGVMTIAFALNSIAGILPVPNFMPQQRPPFADEEKCANFSGTWKGVCAGKTKEETFTINQSGCGSLSVKELPIPLFIGADNVYTVTIPVNGAMAITAINWSGSWNADKSNLLINIGSNTRAVPALEGVNYSYSAKAWMKLVDGDTLTVSSQEAGKPVEDCAYKKQ